MGLETSWDNEVYKPLLDYVHALETSQQQQGFMVSVC